jgi:hypothetical protein
MLKGEFLRANIEKVGRWAFLAGIVLAVVAGLFLEVPAGNFTWVLALLGLVVGLLNVSTKEPQGFLLAAVALALSASAVRSLPLVGGVLTNILANVVTFIAAAMLVAAVIALRWAFLAGIVLAGLAGSFLEVPGAAITWLLAILGLVAGYYNVSAREPQGFLLAAVALTLSASAVQSLPLVGGILTNILANVVTFIAAAMLVAAVKVLLETAKGQTAERAREIVAR